MMHLSELVLKQSKKILDNKRYAIFCAVLLSVLPFAAWISVALVAFVTLRKGAKLGVEVLIPCLVVHSVPLMMFLPVESALVNTIIAFVPCYVSAICLRKTGRWQSVGGVLFFLALSGFLSMQFVAPDFAVNQLVHFKKVLSQYQEYQAIIEASTQGLSELDLAQFFFGLQIFSLLVSSLSSLIFARAIQAKLFVPGGLKSELSDFRGGKLSLTLFLGVALLAFNKCQFAISLLPLTLSYFVMAGFNLIYFIFARKWHVKLVILFFLLLVLQPIVMLFAFMLIGLLDSLFNFRLYLPGRARESL
jgi:hypothetical protein